MTSLPLDDSYFFTHSSLRPFHNHRFGQRKSPNTFSGVHPSKTPLNLQDFHTKSSPPPCRRRRTPNRKPRAASPPHLKTRTITRSESPQKVRRKAKPKAKRTPKPPRTPANSRPVNTTAWSRIRLARSQSPRRPKWVKAQRMVVMRERRKWV
jgi:hypothetical protein